MTIIDFCAFERHGVSTDDEYFIAAREAGGGCLFSYICFLGFCHLLIPSMRCFAMKMGHTMCLAPKSTLIHRGTEAQQETCSNHSLGIFQIQCISSDFVLSIHIQVFACLGARSFANSVLCYMSCFLSFDYPLRSNSSHPATAFAMASKLRHMTRCEKSFR